MRRWLPYPGLAIALFLMWLMLTQSVSPGQIILGAVAAFIGTHAMAALRPEPLRLGSVRAMLKLAGLVFVDVIRSNLAVASIILFPRKERVAGFVRMPLELTDGYGLATLALIITATPGTLWVEFDRGQRTLLVHVFDLIDEEEWVRLIKRRYEALLLEVFGR